jgi:hypothetical protein
LVVDADGLIKLAKAGLIEALVRHADVVVAPEVWREVVEVGGQRGHDDALVVAGLADQVLVQVPRTAAARSLPETAARLGAGERATWALWLDRSAHAIVSDDRAFLTMLGAGGVPFLTPGAVVVRLVELGAVTLDEAREALERLRPFIREGQYLVVREALTKATGSQA